MGGKFKLVDSGGCLLSEWGSSGVSGQVSQASTWAKPRPRPRPDSLLLSCFPRAAAAAADQGSRGAGGGTSAPTKSICAARTAITRLHDTCQMHTLNRVHDAKQPRRVLTTHEVAECCNGNRNMNAFHRESSQKCSLSEPTPTPPSI